MKNKFVISLLVAFLMLGLIGTAVSAKPPVPPVEPEQPKAPAAGAWSWSSESITVNVVPQNTLADTSPDGYSLLMSEGIWVSGATQICHPFRGGQFGWNSEIRLLNGKTWLPIPTNTAWVPDEEGQLMTCAQVYVAGTYTIFGYWVMPEGWNVPKCPPAGAYFSKVLKEGVHCAGTHAVRDSRDNLQELPDDAYCCNDTLYLIGEK